MALSGLSDDELLDIPEANLRPGELTRAFVIRANHNHHIEEIEERRVIERSVAQRQAEDRKSDEETELHRREAVLLQQIRERERELTREAEELDRRTIKLADGRQAYVDGDKYRDEQGRELHGAARAEAEQQHLEQPHAATWQEKKDLDQRREETAQIRRNVENLQAGKGGTDEAKILTATEQKFKTDLAQRNSELQKSNNPSSAYSTDTDVSSLAAGFTAAAAGPGQTDTLFPGSLTATTTLNSKQPKVF